MATNNLAVNGLGTGLMRSYLQPFSISFPTRNATGLGAVIEFYNPSGAVIGTLRSDAQYSSLQSIDFKYGEKGTADFSVLLNRYPDFEVTPFSLMKIKLYDTPYYWYTGEVRYPPEFGTQRDYYEFRGNSLAQHLDNLRADTDYAGTLDIGEVAKDLIINWVTPYCPITYNPSKVTTTTGNALVADIELGKFPLSKVFDTLATMAGAEWGVDGDGDLYFQSIDTTVKRTIFVGYGIESFEPSRNYDAVKNAIIVQRQQDRAAGGAGWSVAGIYNDETSAAKYGPKELNYQIPGYMTDDDADNLGAALLADKKDPEDSAAMTGWLVEDTRELLQRGNYRFILPLATYYTNHDEVEDSTEWTVSGSGDVVLSDDAANVAFGAASVKADFQYAQDQVIILNKTFIGRIKKVRFYIMCTVFGLKFTVGVGQSAWDDYTQDFPIGISNRFLPITIDLESQNLTGIEYFGIKIKEDLSQAASLWLDKIDFEITGNRTYNVRLSKHNYKFSPGNTSVSAEFGEVPPRLENFVAGLKSASSELAFITEKR